MYNKFLLRNCKIDLSQVYKFRIVQSGLEIQDDCYQRSKFMFFIYVDQKTKMATFPWTFLVLYRRKPKGTIVLGSVRLSVRHIKILSCPDFFFTSFDILTWYLVCGYI